MSDPLEVKVGVPQVDNSGPDRQGQTRREAGTQSQRPPHGSGGGSAAGSIHGGTNPMAELTIVFRLRFAVALAAALCLLLFAGTLSARAAASPKSGEYIVQMKKGTTPAAGKRLVRVLGGRVTSPTLRVINGFGAKLSRRAAAAAAPRDGRQGGVAEHRDERDRHGHERRLHLPGRRRDDHHQQVVPRPGEGLRADDPEHVQAALPADGQRVRRRTRPGTARPAAAWASR